MRRIFTPDTIRQSQTLLDTCHCTPFLGVFLCAVLFLALTAGAGELPAAKPNILFIMVDTLRADHVGCYGYKRATTPTIDAVAAEGVRFPEMVAAAPWTMPSLATMLTGVSPVEHRIVGPTNLISDRLTTLAAELKTAGYQTAGVISNPMASHTFGYARGFDFYDDYTVLLSADLNLFDDRHQGRGVHQTVTGEMVNHVALAWLSQKRAPDRPFFLFLLYFDPHADYAPPEKYAAMFTDPDYKGAQNGLGITTLRGKVLPPEDIQHLRDLYDAEIRYTDDRIARMLQELRNKGLDHNTLVVIVADHGEEFWEHGSCTHGSTVYDECVMVPWIMRLPGTLPAGQVFGPQVSHLDLMPTILGLAGCPVPAQCRGRDLSRLLAAGKGDDLPDVPALMHAEIERWVSGVRTPAQKVIGYGDGKLEFYLLKEDPGEKQDLGGSLRVSVFDRLKMELARWELALQKPPEGPTRPGKAQLDAKLTAEMKALGYLH